MGKKKNGCEFCRIVYGMENPLREAAAATRHFLILWNNEKKTELMILYKRHEAFPKDPDEEEIHPSLPKDFGDDLEKAQDLAEGLLGGECYYRWPTQAHYYHYREYVSTEKSEGSVVRLKPMTKDELISVMDEWLKSLPAEGKESRSVPIMHAGGQSYSVEQMAEEIRKGTAFGKEILTHFFAVDRKLRKDGRSIRDFFKKPKVP